MKTGLVHGQQRMDSFSSDNQVRHERVEEAKSKIAQGEYETDKVLDVTTNRLGEDIVASSPSVRLNKI